MNNQKPEEIWIELKEALGKCSLCIHNAICEQMKTHAKHCQQAKYRFKCPIEVLDQGRRKDNMPHKTPCTWRKEPHSENVSQICSICYGYVHVNEVDHCPFFTKYEICPEVQHLITTEERFYSISQLRKLEELRQG